jgi:hypothetical protein
MGALLKVRAIDERVFLFDVIAGESILLFRASAGQS